MTSVNTNISASKASLAMSNANKAQVQSAERLSSGKRINGGADDAAGMAVSSKMNAIFMGQKAAIKTATDAVSLLKTQEAGVEQLINIMQRVRELAVQMANGTYSDADRGLAQLESDALMDQFLMVATGTKFNEKQVLNGAFGDTLDIQSGPTAGETFTIAMVPGGLFHSVITGSSMNKISSQSDAQNALDILGGPINTFLEVKATLGASVNRLNHTISYLSQSSVYTETANGRIVDADFAKEASINSKQTILYQSASQMLSIANDTKQNLLQLFR
ncbi:flagellin [Alphaproteobacteria bacterium]|nr:flagellin [Alphaproteobacteria bacterium]